MTAETSTPAVDQAEDETPQPEAVINLTPRGSYVLDALMADGVRGVALITPDATSPPLPATPRYVDGAAFEKVAASARAAEEKAQADADRAYQAARAEAGLHPAVSPALGALPDGDSPMTRYERAHEMCGDGEVPERTPSRLRAALGRCRRPRQRAYRTRQRDVYPLAAPPPPLAAPEPSWAETTAHDGMPRIPRFVPRGAELASDRAYTPHGTHRRSVWET